MRYAWDQEEVYFGRGRGPVAGVRRRILRRLRKWDASTASRVDRFVANSSFVAGRITRYYGRSSTVVAPPVDTGFFTPPDRPPERSFALVVASLSPYKKVDLSIQACEAAGIPLRVVGDGPERDRLARRADGRVELLGRVPADRLRELYRDALCFLQPGVEDFGISAVEALACGTPVVALGQGGVLDIVRDGLDGVLFARDEPAEIALAIDKCRQIQFNSVNLRERADSFSAERFRSRLRELLVSDWPRAERYLT
jgi:glycosyltransferase involved in cell wall biosynthesis